MVNTFAQQKKGSGALRLVLSEICEFGIAEIDNGHDRIIFMINEIGDCILNRDFSAALRQTIHLIAVERKHVQTETRLLEEYQYTQIDSHNEYHWDLNQILNQLMVSLGDGEVEAATKIHTNLATSLIDDILRADLPFKSLLQHKMNNA